MRTNAARQIKPKLPRARHLRVMTEAIDEQGRYDAAKVAELLDWSRQEIATYLERDPSAISRNGASLGFQQPLSRLVATFANLLELLNDDLKTARAWLRTPIKVLDGKSPKEKILHGELKTVEAVIAEIESGFSA